MSWFHAGGKKARSTFTDLDLLKARFLSKTLVITS